MILSEEGWEVRGADLGPLKVTSVETLGDTVRFTVLPDGDWCKPTSSVYKNDYDEYGIPGYWETDPDKGWATDFRAEFMVRSKIRKRIVMTRNLARNLTEEVLYRRYSWFGDANQGGYRCRISGNRGRCRHVFGIGDGAVIGVVKMRLVGRNGQKPLWNYRLNALQIDELCRYVTHIGDCTRPIKKQRSRVSLPSWVNAKTIR